MRYLLLAQALYAAAATKNVAARTTDELGAPGARLTPPGACMQAPAQNQENRQQAVAGLVELAGLVGRAWGSKTDV